MDLICISPNSTTWRMPSTSSPRSVDLNGASSTRVAVGFGGVMAMGLPLWRLADCQDGELAQVRVRVLAQFHQLVGRHPRDSLFECRLGALFNALELRDLLPLFAESGELFGHLVRGR